MDNKEILHYGKYNIYSWTFYRYIKSQSVGVMDFLHFFIMKIIANENIYNLSAKIYVLVTKNK